MTLEEVKQYLKDNLTIDSKTTRGRYGNDGHITVAIFLEGEIISQTYIEIIKE